MDSTSARRDEGASDTPLTELPGCVGQAQRMSRSIAGTVRRSPLGDCEWLPWQRFRSVVATHWLRGLLGVLGVFELLMAISAAPNITVATGLVAGSKLIAAAVVTRPGKRTMMAVLVAATLPFAVVTWWTIVAPLLTVVAFVIGFAATGRNVRSTDAGTGAVPDRQPVL